MSYNFGKAFGPRKEYDFAKAFEKRTTPKSEVQAALGQKAVKPATLPKVAPTSEIDRYLLSDIAPDQGYKGYNTALPDLSPRIYGKDVVQGFTSGRTQGDYGKALFDNMLNPSEEKAKQVEELRSTYEQGQVDPEKLTGMGSVIVGGAQVLGQQSKNIVKGLAGAAAGGAGGFLVGGPAGAATGAKIGFNAATAFDTFRQEAGFAFDDYSKQGIPREQAVPAALATGAVNAALEVLQISDLIKTIPGLSNVVGKASSELIKKTTAQIVKDYVKFTAKETAEEAMQRLVTDTIGQMAGVVAGTRQGMDAGELVSGMVEEAKAAAPSMLGVGLPGLGTQLITSKNTQAAPKIETEPKAQVEVPKVQTPAPIPVQTQTRARYSLLPELNAGQQDLYSDRAPAQDFAPLPQPTPYAGGRVSYPESAAVDYRQGMPALDTKTIMEELTPKQAEALVISSEVTPTEADRRITGEQYTTPKGVKETIDAFRVRLKDLDLTADEVREHQKWLRENKEAVIAYYLDAVSNHPDHKRKRQATKQALAEQAYSNAYARAAGAINGFTSYSFGETQEQGIDRAIEKLTNEDIAKAKAKVAAIRQAMENPQTLSDYHEIALRRALTPQERAIVEDLRAKQSREIQSKQAERKPKMDLTNLETEKAKHTKTGADIWVVRPKTRLEKEAFDQLRKQMGELGGRWSSYTRGFNFDHDPAEQLSGITPAEAPQKTTNAGKLRQMADNLQPKIDEKRAPRQANTAKRASQAAGAEAHADYLEMQQRTLRNIADGIESGTIALLDRVTAMTEIEALERSLSLAKRKYEQKNNIGYSESKKRKVTIEDVASAEFKLAVYADHLQRAIMQGELTPGVARIAKRLGKLKADGHLIDITKHVEDVERLLKAVNQWDGTSMKEIIEGHKRLQRIGINSDAELRAYLREYLSAREQKEATKEDRIKAKQRALINVKIPGYFPTPKTIVDRMLKAADIQEGDKVLEPSAGQGHIADAVGVGKVDVVEISSSNREILELKGHKIVGEDALQVEGQYDKIVMNPPFENGQDIDHVRHAYDTNLKPGGRLVAIMSEGPFFRGDKKAVAFREWLEEVGGTSERLPEGSFKESDRSTGVATRMVTIEKPQVESARSEIAATSQDSITKAEAVAAVEQVIEETKQAGKLNLRFDLQQFAKKEQQRLTSLLDDVKKNGVTDQNREQVKEVVERKRRQQSGKADMPMSERTYENVANAKSYSVQHPEVKPFMQAEAKKVKQELAGGVKGEMVFIEDPWGYVDSVSGVQRDTSPTVAAILDTTKATYAEVSAALDEVISGEPKTALAKKVELFLHENLTEGSEDMFGNKYDPDNRYVTLTRELEKTFYQQQYEKAMADLEKKATRLPAVKELVKEKKAEAVKKERQKAKERLAQRVTKLKERHADDIKTQQNMRKEALEKLRASAERKAQKAKVEADQRLSTAKRKADFELAEAKQAAKMAEGRIRAEFNQKLRAERKAAIDKRKVDQSIRQDRKARAYLKQQIKKLRKQKLRPEFEAVRDLVLPHLEMAVSGAGTLNLARAKEFLKGKDDALISRLDMIDGLPVRELTADTIEVLSDLARSVITQNKNENRLLADAKAKEIGAAITEALLEIGAPDLARSLEPKPSMLDLSRSLYGTESMTPRVLAKYVGGGKEGVLFRVLYENLDAGQNKSLALEQKAKTYIDEQVKGIKLEEWTGEASRETFSLSSGKIALTPMERISLYLASRNEDNRRHLMEGGGTIEGQQKPFKFKAKDFATLEESLTPEQKRYADALAYVFDEILKSAINETSLVLDGYEKAKVKNYFPIVIAKHLQDQDFSKFLRWATLEGKGYLKQREHSAKPVMIEDASRAAERAIHMVADYHGMAIPLRDAKVILGNAKVGNALQRKHGNSRAERYFRELFRQLEGGRLTRDTAEKGLGALSSNIIKSILGANPWIIMQQFASLPKAALLVDPKYLVNTRKADWETIYKYSPYIWKRGKGYVSKEAAELADARRIGTSGKLETARVKVSEFMLGMIEKADAAVIGRVWNAAESEVKATTELEGDALYKEVARRTEDIIKRTQQSGMLMQRSALTRNEHAAMRILVAFTSESNATANMVREAWMGRKTDPKFLARTIAVTTASALVSATINVMRNKWRGKEDDWGDELMSAAVSPVYFAEAVLNVVKGEYWASIGNTVTQSALDNFLGSINKLGKAISGEGTATISGAAREFLTTASSLLGIPANNVMKELDTIMSKVDPRIAYGWRRLFKEPTNSELYSEFFAEVERNKGLRDSGLLDDLKVDMNRKVKKQRDGKEVLLPAVTAKDIITNAKARNRDDNPDNDVDLKLLRDLDRWLR